VGLGKLSSADFAFVFIPICTATSLASVTITSQHKRLVFTGVTNTFALVRLTIMMRLGPMPSMTMHHAHKTKYLDI